MLLLAAVMVVVVVVVDAAVAKLWHKIATTTALSTKNIVNALVYIPFHRFMCQHRLSHSGQNSRDETNVGTKNNVLKYTVDPADGWLMLCTLYASGRFVLTPHNFYYGRNFFLKKKVSFDTYFGCSHFRLCVDWCARELIWSHFWILARFFAQVFIRMLKFGISVVFNWLKIHAITRFSWCVYSMR